MPLYSVCFLIHPSVHLRIDDTGGVQPKIESRNSRSAMLKIQTKELPRVIESLRCQSPTHYTSKICITKFTRNCHAFPTVCWPSIWNSTVVKLRLHAWSRSQRTCYAASFDFIIRWQFGLCSLDEIIRRKFRAINCKIHTRQCQSISHIYYIDPHTYTNLVDSHATSVKRIHSTPVCDNMKKKYLSMCSDYSTVNINVNCPTDVLEIQYVYLFRP